MTGSEILSLSVAVLLSLLCTGNCFHLRHGRDQGFINQVKLRCFSNQGQLSNAYFSLDGDDLESRVATFRADRALTFNIRPDLEGEYTCSDSSTGQLSDPISLIFLPPNDFISSPPPVVYAEFGSTAVLKCSVTPGRLFQQYYATWSNGSNSSQPYYARIPIPSTDGIVATVAPSTSRHYVSRSSLALTISNVTLSDSGMTYRCIVGVVSPSTGVSYSYESTRTINIRLVIYKRPQIIKPPEPQTISLQESLQVRYVCVAVGDPTPQITWTHNGKPTTSPTQYHIHDYQPILDPEGRGFIVNSSLGIFPLDETSTGNVTCTARVSRVDQQNVGGAIPSDAHTARLSVLGGFKDVGILITQGGDVIFKLSLRAVINVPVNILMVYTDARKESFHRTKHYLHQSNRTTTASFNNTDAITHIVFKSRVPFDIFRVGVALVSGSVEGPVQNNSRVHNVNLPSLISTSLLQTQLIVASVVPISFFVLLFAAVFTITLVKYFGRTRRRELEFQKSVLDRHVDVLEILLERLPEDPSGHIYIQLLQVVERILTINMEENASTPSPTPPSYEGDGTSERGMQMDTLNSDLPEMSLKSSALVRTLGNVIEKGRQNPKLRPHLDRQMSNIILDRTESTRQPFRRGACFEELLDGGYAGSHSTSSKEEQELDQKLEEQC